MVDRIFILTVVLVSPPNSEWFTVTYRFQLLVFCLENLPPFVATNGNARGESLTHLGGDELYNTKSASGRFEETVVKFAGGQTSFSQDGN